MHRFASTPAVHILYHKKEWQYKHGQYNNMVNECCS